MLKKFTSVRFILSMLLLLSVMFAGYSIYYKVKYWGFEISPKTVSDVWTIEAHISFEPTGEPVTVSLTTPGNSNAFKILEEDVVAPGYKVKKVNNETSRMILTAPAQTTPQDIYYRVMLFDNIDTRGKIKAPQPAAPKMPIMDEQTLTVAQQIIKLADQSQQGDDVSKIIRFINQVPADPTVQSYLPIKKTQKDIADAVRNLLSIKKIPNRVARGFKLEESKKSLSPDLMLQAYIDNQWKTYNLKDGAKGLPENFVIFQRGGESLIDVMGGENSVIKFSVMKSVTSSLSLASRRAKLAGQKSLFRLFHLQSAAGRTKHPEMAVHLSAGNSDYRPVKKRRRRQDDGNLYSDAAFDVTGKNGVLAGFNLFRRHYRHRPAYSFCSFQTEPAFGSENFGSGHCRYHHYANVNRSGLSVQTQRCPVCRFLSHHHYGVDYRTRFRSPGKKKEPLMRAKKFFTAWWPPLSPISSSAASISVTLCLHSTSLIW